MNPGEILDEERQRILAEGADRVRELWERAQAAMYGAMREAADEVDRIRVEVLAMTGVEIVAELPEKVPYVMDVPMGALAEQAERCTHLLAAVELLSPHVQHGSVRTVGAVLKTGVDVPTGAMALHWLRQSKFYAPEEVAL